jgi:peptide/nickel transport system ATP-binding protein
MADRVAVMQDGRIVEEGTRVQVTQQPRAGYTLRLLAAVPQLRQGWLDSVAPSVAG